MCDHPQCRDYTQANAKEGGGYRFADGFAEFDDAVHVSLAITKAALNRSQSSMM
jgi:hypothetical protein